MVEQQEHIGAEMGLEEQEDSQPRTPAQTPRRSERMSKPTEKFQQGNLMRQRQRSSSSSQKQNSATQESRQTNASQPEKQFAEGDWVLARHQSWDPPSEAYYPAQITQIVDSGIIEIKWGDGSGIKMVRQAEAPKVIPRKLTTEEYEFARQDHGPNIRPFQMGVFDWNTNLKQAIQNEIIDAERNKRAHPDRSSNSQSEPISPELTYLQALNRPPTTTNWDNALKFLLEGFDIEALLNLPVSANRFISYAVRPKVREAMKAVLDLMDQIKDRPNLHELLRKLLAAMPVLLLRNEREGKQSAADRIDKLCQKFLDGKWKQLYQQACKKCAKPAKPRKILTPQQEKDSKHKRATELEKIVNISKAMATLRGPGTVTASTR